MWLKGCFFSCLLLLVLCFVFEKVAAETIELTDRVVIDITPIKPYYATIKNTMECGNGGAALFLLLSNNTDETGPVPTACYHVFDVASGQMNRDTACGTIGYPTAVQCLTQDGDEFCVTLDSFSQKISLYSASFNNLVGEITATNAVLIHLTPSVFGFNSQNIRYIYYADSEINTTIYSISVGLSVGTPMPVIHLHNTEKIVGLTGISTTRIIVAIDQQTSVQIYNSVSGEFIESYGSFGNVGPLALDSFLADPRLYVTDPVNNKIHIADMKGGWANNEIIGIEGIVNVVPGRGYTMITHETDGIVVIYNDPFEYRNVTVENATCSTGGSVTVRVRGGSYIYKYNIMPVSYNFDGNPNSVESGSWEETIVLPTVNENVRPIYIYKDSTHAACVLGGGNESDTTVVYNGNYSVSLTMFSTGLRMTCRGQFFNPAQYQLEFMTNFGNGGQEFAVKQNCADDDEQSLLKIYSADYTLNEWHKINVTFPSTIPANGDTSALYFCDISGARDAAGVNLMYFDDIMLSPISPVRWVVAQDLCISRDAGKSTDSFTLYDGNVLSVSTTTIQPSCNNDGQNGDLSLDGELIATAVGGQAPYTYSWGISSTTGNNVSNLGAMDYNLIVYSDDLNPIFDDASISSGKIVRDSTVVNSGTHSFSMTPKIEAEGLAFNLADIDSPLSGADYYALEMWINGGQWGGQDLQFVFVLRTKDFDARSIATRAKLAAIPPQKWFKLTIDIDPDLSFTGFKIYNIKDLDNNLPQPRIYFDDIVLLHRNSRVTAVDAKGCRATYSYAKIEEPSAISLGTVVSNLQCFESADGSVSLNPVGGVSPYHFTWSPSRATDRVIGGLNESRVNIDVTDSNGCYPTDRTVTVDVLQPPKLAFLVSTTPAICSGGQGQLQVSVYGGIRPYTYVWSSDSGSTFSVVPQPQPVEVFTDNFNSNISLLSQSNATRICGGTGTHIGSNHDLSHSGYCSIKSGTTGTTSFGFQCQQCLDDRYTAVQFWIYFERPEDIEFYTAQFSGTQLSDPLPLSGQSKSNASNGWQLFEVPRSINASAFMINAQQSNLMPFWIDDIVLLPASRNLLYPGITVNTGFKSIIRGPAAKYTLTVTDGNLCSSKYEIDIEEPKKLTFGGDDDEVEGTVDWSVDGGLPPYQFFIVETNTTVTNETKLEAGTYTIRVIDANGCEADKKIEILPLKDYSKGLVAGLAVVIGLGVCVFILAAILLTMYKVKCQGKSIFYNGVLLAGVLLAFISAALLLPTQTDELCVSFVWLLGVGFVFVYGCLFIKTWGLYRVWRNATKYKRTNLTPIYIMKCVGVALLVEVILLVIWTTVDPPRVVKVKMVNDTVERMCESDTPTFWIIFLTLKGIWMIIGAVMSFLTRNIMEEYNESKSIAYAIYNNVVLCIIAIPLAVLLREVPSGRLVIMVAVIVLAFTFTVVLMFFRMWRRVFEKDIEMKTRQPGNSSRSTATRGSASHYSKNSNDSGSKSAPDTPTPPRANVSVELA